MADQNYIDQVSSRIDRLLLRHQELLRTQQLLEAQVQALSEERDRLREQCASARQRIDALLEYLPPAQTAPQEPTP
jgi:cell division protein ZapB